MGGLGYLLGVATADEGGKLAYECRWALDRGQERTLFEWFIGLTFERLQRRTSKLKDQKLVEVEINGAHDVARTA
jgi:hypothetical protein